MPFSSRKKPRLHPLVTRLVDSETLEKMGAKKVGDA